MPKASLSQRDSFGVGQFKIYNLKLSIMKTKTNIKPLLILALVVLLSSNQNIAQNVGIGAASFTPDPSAMLEVKSTELNPKGFLPPRMTTAVRDEIQNPATGLVIFNTTSNCLNYRVGSNWFEVCGDCTPLPATPTAGTHIPNETQIIWNWNASAGATGYKWHTTNDYAAATNLGNTTTVTQTGLTCSTINTIYVWAYNTCGNSTELTLTQTTSACPICDVPSVTFTYKSQQVTYGTVESSGKCWLDRNLGASQVATSTTDAASYGDLFQWGRGDDGHQTRTSGTTTTLSNTDQPAHANFILAPNDPWDWRSPQNVNLWQGVNGINNPCPSGWRVPTEEEWETERQSWAPNNNAAGAFASPLKLPRAGERYAIDGSLFFVGSSGHYWSSSVDGANSRNLKIYSGNAVMSSNYMASGFSARCIKD